MSPCVTNSSAAREVNNNGLAAQGETLTFADVYNESIRDRRSIDPLPGKVLYLQTSVLRGLQELWLRERDV